jgi:hypothetical protein
MTLTAPPLTPATGDRHVIAAVASGLWLGKETQIAEWSGTAWIYTVPNKGFTANNEADGIDYNFNGTAWVNIGAAVPTGTPVSITDSTNFAGSASSLAKSDHQHAHGNRGGGSLHATVSASGAGFYPQSNLAATTNPAVGNDTTQGYAIGSKWLNLTTKAEWVCFDASTGAAVWKETTNIATTLVQKAGVVLAASFAGNPKKATVSFATAFADANYAVTPCAVTTNSKTFAIGVESQLAGSFVINMGANNITDLVQVDWHATKNGEST